MSFDNPADYADGEFGVAVSCAGDINGDGLADLAIGADHQMITQFTEGALYIYFGRSDLGTDPEIDDADHFFANPASQQGGRFGRSATIGDLNGDGFEDLIAGAYLQDNPEGNEGNVFVYAGSEAFAAPTTPVVVDNPLGAVSGWFGETVGVGDYEADGFGDLVVAAYPQNEVYIFRGQASIDSVGLTPATVLHAPVESSSFGAALAY